MSKTRMRSRRRLNLAVEKMLGGLTICKRCEATIGNYADRCAAGLGERCEGFGVVEAAIRSVGKLVADRSAAAPPEWLAASGGQDGENE